MMNSSLLKIIFHRISSSLLVLFLVISFVFVIIHLSPGDPSLKYLSPKLSPKLFKEISEMYKFNGTFIEQYIAFVRNIFSGDFGISYSYRQSVTTVVKDYFIFTILFGLVAFSFQIIAALLLAYLSFHFKSRWLEKMLSSISLTLYSVPLFISGILLLYFFTFKFSLFPASGLRSFNFSELSFGLQMLDYLKHLFLPLLASSFVAIPIYYKYLYSSIKTNSSRNFVKNLAIMGVSENIILFKNIIPNSLNSLIAVAGVELGVLLGGSVIVETIFGLPGMGRLTMMAVMSRDYPLIIATVILSSVVILVVNLISDIVRIMIDKRLLKRLLS